MCANRGYECIRPAHAPNVCVIPVTFIIPGEFWLPPFTSAIIRLYLSGLDSISPSVFQSFSSALHALQAKSLMINDAGTFGWSRTHAYRRLSANLIYQISPSCCWRRMMQLIFERCVWYFSTPRLFAHAHLWQQLDGLLWKPWNGVLFPFHPKCIFIREICSSWIIQITQGDPNYANQATRLGHVVLGGFVQFPRGGRAPLWWVLHQQKRPAKTAR